MTDETAEPARFVKVGDTMVPVNESEWVVACAPNGSTLRVTSRAFGSRPPGRPFEMVLRFSWFYDGVIGEGYEPDPDDFVTRTIHPALGDVVEFIR